MGTVSTTIRRRRTATIVAVCAAFIILAVWYLRYNDGYWNHLYVMKQIANSRFFFKINSNISNQDTTHRIKNPGLILDTPGCKIPKLDPFDSSIVELYEAKDPYPCPGHPLFMHSQPDGSIALNATTLKTYYNVKPNDIVCSYQSIRRRYEKPGNVRENDYELRKHKVLEFGVPLEQEYVFVNCYMGEENKNFTQYFALAYLKKEVEKKKSSIPPPKPQLNVILAGVDSISKLNYLRHFKKTQSFIKAKGSFFDMKGYTKVGDNTFPNLTPLLTGRSAEEIWNETVADTMFFDDVDFIWKRYAAKGFRTFYAEDSPFFGTYNYGRRGFHNVPTDYYMRPLYLAMHNSALRKQGPFYCFNSELEPDVIYDYLKDFVRAMGPRPYFAFAMSSSITHDYLNYAGYADYPTVKLLEDLWDIGAHNNSVIVLFGDHGLRFGAIRETYVGKFEERMPFMYIHFPPWFIHQYPSIAKHIRENQERLVTLFDIHATLIQLLDPTTELSIAEQAATSPHGLSLMGEISPYRTCVRANIYPHWCACQVFEELSVNSDEVLKASSLVKDCINTELKAPLSSCPTLKIEKILTARLGQLNDMVLRFVKHQHDVIDHNVVYGKRIVKYEDYLITLVASPGNRKFESTVRHDVIEDTYCVVDVYEFDSYDKESACIDPQKLEAFSYCNS